MQAQHVGGAEAAPREVAGFVVLDQHIGVRCEVANEGSASIACEVDLDRALVAVGREEVGRVALCIKGRAPPARVIAVVGPLHFDDIRAEVAEQLCAAWPGEDA